MDEIKNGRPDGLVKCAFCGRGQAQVRKLIAGPGRRLHLRCMRRRGPLHRRGRQAPAGGEGAGARVAPHSRRGQGRPGRVYRRPGQGQEEDRRRRLQPLQAHRAGPDPLGCRDRQEQHPADRADRDGQDPDGPDPGPHPVRPLRHRRRHDPDRGGLCRRGRGERHPQAVPGGQGRHRPGPEGHHLHRRDRQDQPQERQPLDHPGRLGGGRAAGPAQDHRGHQRQHPAPGRAQAPLSGVHPGRHDRHPVHLRRRLRRPGPDHRPAAGPLDGRVQGRGQGQARRRLGLCCPSSSRRT